MKEVITSRANPKIKNLARLLEKASERKKQDRIVIEGRREIEAAIGAGFRVENVFVCEELAGKARYENAIYISKSIFERIAYRGSSDGLLAVVHPRRLPLYDLRLSSNPLLIVLEAVEKPGNLGAILRTADAADADAVIVCDPQTDIYNPNVIRSSIGCVFTRQVAVSSSEEVLEYLHQKKIKPFAAALTAAKFYTQTNLAQPCAIVMGTEDEGLSQKWLGPAEQIRIPMRGKADSLNVSASCAILLFEAVRQRG